MQEGARGIRLAIAGYERVMEGADMRASVLTLAAGECVPWHYHSTITDSFVCLEGPMEVETRAPRAVHRLRLRAALRGGAEDRAHGAWGGWRTLPVPADARSRGVRQRGGRLGADPALSNQPRALPAGKSLGAVFIPDNRFNRYSASGGPMSVKAIFPENPHAQESGRAGAIAGAMAASISACRTPNSPMLR